MFSPAQAARANSPMIRLMPQVSNDDGISVDGPENDTGAEDIACDDVPEDEVQDVLALVNKVLRKGTKGKESDPNKFNDQSRKAFNDADADQWNTHIRTGVVPLIPPEKAKDIDRSRILRLPPRFVRTDKDDQNPDLAELEATSCVVLPGHVAP